MEKAYDTTWKHGILLDLYKTGLRGRLPMFIYDFLSDCYFINVRVGNTYSDSYSQEAIVPQGSILSVTLFSLKINSIVSCLLPDIKCSLYVDDLAIYYSSSHMPSVERKLQHSLNRLGRWCDENGFKFSPTNTMCVHGCLLPVIKCSLYVDDLAIYYSSCHMPSIERKLQHSLNRLGRWCDENGFKFSPAKTMCVHFCQLRKHHLDPQLYLNGTQIPTIGEAKLIYLIFDSKLSFIPHITCLTLKGPGIFTVFHVGADLKLQIGM